MVFLGARTVLTSPFHSDPLLDVASHDELSEVSVVRTLVEKGTDISEGLRLKSLLARSFTNSFVGSILVVSIEIYARDSTNCLEAKIIKFIITLRIPQSQGSQRNYHLSRGQIIIQIF